MIWDCIIYAFVLTLVCYLIICAIQTFFDMLTYKFGFVETFIESLIRFLYPHALIIWAIVFILNYINLVNYYG